MSKKFLLPILAILAILAIFSAFYLNSKLKSRKLRQQLYNEALNKKAEEIKLTFLEGWNNQEIAKYLEEKQVLTKAEFNLALESFKMVDYVFLPKEAEGNLQGFLYPDSYQFFKSITDRTQTTAKQAGEAIIKKLLDNFKSKLPEKAEELAKKQGLSLYQAIILASILEKEANDFPEEKQIIAGIFYNRLKIGMLLQSDATVNYATGKNEPSPSLKDLEFNSPYNTYVYKGLAPTPIANPSIKSINAVLQPKLTEYLYYLHDQKTGRPYYAQTHEEHVQNKLKYLK